MSVRWQHGHSWAQRAQSIIIIIIIIVRLTLLRSLRALTIDDHRRLGRLYEGGIRGGE